MQTYVALIDFTAQGVENLNRSPDGLTRSSNGPSPRVLSLKTSIGRPVGTTVSWLWERPANFSGLDLLMLASGGMGGTQTMRVPLVRNLIKSSQTVDRVMSQQTTRLRQFAGSKRHASVLTRSRP